jgi:hypothetical protein
MKKPLALYRIVLPLSVTCLMFSGVGAQTGTWHRSVKISAHTARLAVLKEYPDSVFGKTTLVRRDGVWQYQVRIKSGSGPAVIDVDASSGEILGGVLGDSGTQSPDVPLIGTWTGQNDGMPETVVFRPDNTFEVSGRFKDKPHKFDLTLVMRGTYKIEGSKVKMHFVSQQATPENSESGDVADAANKSPIQPDEIDDIKVKNRNHLTVTDKAGKKHVLTRKG